MPSASRWWCRISSSRSPSAARDRMYGSLRNLRDGTSTS
jgi:hypothetical protein